MKIKYKCRLIMTDEIRDDEVEEVLSTEEIAERLIADLKIGLTENGHVLIEDASMETEKDSKQKDGEHMTAVWIYTFSDGTCLKLLDRGLSVEEVWKMQLIHGKCEMSRTDA